MVEEEAELDLLQQVVRERGEAIGAFHEVLGMPRASSTSAPAGRFPVGGQAFQRQIARADDAGDRRYLQRHDGWQEAAHGRHPSRQALELRVTSRNCRFGALEPEPGLVPR